MPIDQLIFERLQQNDPSLTTLDLSKRTLNNSDIAQLVNALSQNTTLTSLDFSYFEMGAKVASALSQHTTLTSLDIRGNYIGAEGAIALSQNNTLTSLDISGNYIETEGVIALSQNKALTSLNISGNQLEDETEQAIAKMLAANKQHQQEQRNRFILTLSRGLATVNALSDTTSLPLPPELIDHMGSFLDAHFYLQLAAINHPAHIGKTAQ